MENLIKLKKQLSLHLSLSLLESLLDLQLYCILSSGFLLIMKVKRPQTSNITIRTVIYWNKLYYSRRYSCSVHVSIIQKCVHILAYGEWWREFARYVYIVRNMLNLQMCICKTLA